MDVLIRATLRLAVVLAFGGCNPDLPTRDCDAPEDCFTQERCVAGSCVEAALLADATAPVPREDGARGADVEAASDGATDAAQITDGSVVGLDGKVVDGARPDVGDVTPDAADPDGAGPDGPPPDAGVAPDGGRLDGAVPPDGGLDVDGGAVADGGPDGPAPEAGPDGAAPDARLDGARGIDLAPGDPPADGAVDPLPLDAGGGMMVPDAALEPA